MQCFKQSETNYIYKVWLASFLLWYSYISVSLCMCVTYPLHVK